MCQLGKRRVAGLGQLPSGGRLPTAWNVYFAASDVSDTARQVERAGGSITIGPLAVLDHGELAMACDCGGATFGLWQAKRHIGAELMHEANTLAWCEVNTRNSALTAAFYRHLLQLENGEHDKDDCYTLRRGNDPVCGIVQLADDENITPHWMVHFAVPDVDSAAARVVAAGGRLYDAERVLSPPRGRCAVVEDPMGAVFALIPARPSNQSHRPQTSG